MEELKWNVQEYIKHGKENAVNEEWMKQLENASAQYHINRLEALKLQMRQSMENLFSDQQKTIDGTMRKVYKSGYYHTAYEIQKGVGVGWDLAKIDDRKIRKAINKPWAADGKNFSERIWGNRQRLINEMNTTLTQNIILGQDPQKAIDTIAKKLNTSKLNAGRLVMTEEAFFSSAAQKDCFAELDVEQYEIVATLDSHTSDICQDMDGKRFKMSEWEVGVTAPPFHVNCRSTTVPYDPDFDDDVGMRAARDEETGKTYYVPENMTYKEWEKAFVQGDKTEECIMVPDVKYRTKQHSDITPKRRLSDMMTVSAAYNELPVKVKREMSEAVFEFGYTGSACDINNKTVRVGMGISKEEVFHEMGHLVENYMMKPSDTKKYKEFLVDGLTSSDIMIKTYYDTLGNPVDIFVLSGERFESEYQSRMYVRKLADALNRDGSINVDVLGETISEIFRKYMSGEHISNMARKLIEEAVL